jgi:hypothetical protein
MVNFIPMFVMLGVSLVLFLIAPLFAPKKAVSEKRSVTRTPRPNLEEWQEGNTICYGVIYKGSKPSIPSPSERYDPTQRPKRLHFVEINGQKYEVRV